MGASRRGGISGVCGGAGLFSLGAVFLSLGAGLLAACSGTPAGAPSEPSGSGGGGSAGTSVGGAGAAVPTGGEGGAVADFGATCSPGTSIPSGDFPRSLFPLNLGTQVSQSVPPPAISGGTLLPLMDGATVAASDPDRDSVYLVDLSSRAVRTTLQLPAGAEPGRLAQDSSGIVHVALRRGGAVVSIDPFTAEIVGRRDVCAAPRGIAYEAATDLLHVACAGGELVSLPASGGDAVRTLTLPSDLRDVVVVGRELRVSRFRSAELLTVSAEGAVTARATLPVFRSVGARGGQAFSPAVAWRAVGMVDGGVAMVHQRGCDDVVQHGGGNGTDISGAYGNAGTSCDGIIHSTVSVVAADGTIRNGPMLSNMPLPVDLALSPDGTQLAIVSAANGHNLGLSSVQVVSRSEITGPTNGGDTCMIAAKSSCRGCVGGAPAVNGEAVAVAYASDGSLLVQTREPATLVVGSQGVIALSPDSRADTGHMVFHANAGAGLACASCHAEGLDDGRVWNFACVGARRTQSLQTGLRGTEPFHWNGDEKDFPTLVHDIFTMRMSGPQLNTPQMDATLAWIDGQPRLARAGVDASAAARGQAVFVKASCATCHMGDHLTNGQTVDVGTGGAFQVPSLVGISTHPPYMHNGCAATLGDRFKPSCGGGDKHGTTSALSSDELADLVAYLGTL